MSKKGTGLKKVFLNKAKKKYLKRYKSIMSLIYTYKEYRDLKKHPKISKEYKKDIKKYWKQYNIKPNKKEFGIYAKHYKNENPKFITKRVFHSNIETTLNNYFYSIVLSNKNFLELFLKEAHLPETKIRKFNGVLLDKNYKLINEEEAYNIIKQERNEMIFKPSIDTCGGDGIIFFNNSINRNDFISLINNNNFIVQKVLKQNKELADFNGSSLNTVRVLSLLFNNEVYILYMVLRVGKDGMKVDNASAGGIQIVVKEDGYFSDCIVTIDLSPVKDNKVLEKFKNKKMPFYDEIIKEVKRLHPFLATCGLIGWDVAIDEKGNPTIIEANLDDIGMTDKSQCVNGPLFGELTDDVLNYITNRK